MVQEVDTMDSEAEEEYTPPVTHRLPTSMSATPSERQTTLGESIVHRSLLLGGPRLQGAPSAGASAMDPVTLSSP